MRGFLSTTLVTSKTCKILETTTVLKITNEDEQDFLLDKFIFSGSKRGVTDEEYGFVSSGQK